MNFSQMHERLRLELLRRIQRGTVSVSLLAHQTGMAQAHLSNFLHSRRQLSLQALDRVLAAKHLTTADLMPAPSPPGALPLGEQSCAVPIVSHATALFEPFIRPSAVLSVIPIAASALQAMRARVSSPRRSWERFVAVRISAADALPMEPLVLPDAVAILDRHYTSLMAYRPSRPNLYALRHGAHLTLRYVELVGNRLVLRPHNLAFPVELIEVGPGEPPTDHIAGRIAIVTQDL